MQNIVLVAKTVFAGVWDLCLNTLMPGTNLSIAAFVVALMIIGFALKLFSVLTGFRMGGSTYGKAATSADKVKHLRDKRSGS